jgi:hypothetical protein
MKTKLIALAFAGLSVAATVPVVAAPNVGVSIGINQPGVYGRIDIGGYPQPALVYPEPVVIVQQPVAVQRQPIYLYVPLAHQQNWRRYCGRYSACGQPVYFVQDRWVRERWQEEHTRREHGDNGRHRGWDKQADRGHREGDRNDRGSRNDRGDRGDRGDGHGRGH